ncbi:MAG: hypothetical protein LBU15_01790 [Rickettsiales bacterium]|jgi:phospholipase/carboxylesterase|nr:hypothetical protein [Rickettsiales bacterium]
MLNFVRRLAKSGRNRYALFLLHGYYASGENIMGLAEYFSKISDDLCFIAPDAPEKIADGGYQWFPLDRDYITPESVAGVVSKSHGVLCEFLERQREELSLAYRNIFMLGFSQGAMVALYTGIRLAHRIGGLVSFSGLQPDSPESIRSDARTGQKILMLHSPSDSLVPFICLSYSEKLLRDSGSEVTTHVCRHDVGHSIDYDCLDVAGDFIAGAIRELEREV